jgi:iron complex outermembrane receptor protein
MNKHTVFTKSALYVAVAGCLGTLAAPVLAQDQAAEPDESLDEVVVTGTRVAERTRLQSLAPVDVITTQSLESQATTELAEALSNAAPSLNFPRPSITDGTDHIRPATLRGLAPDQTLVLVNSKRRHQSALVNVNGSIGRGSAAVDLNSIPLAAIESIEVLRDGASAQYGSDAIAGVINLRLRDAREGGAASLTYGEYNTDVETERGQRKESDGATLTASVWKGLPLGDEGFLTLSAEYRDRDPTSRGDFDSRVPGSPVTSRYGDAQVEDITAYVNAGVPLQNEWEIYGWAGYQQREGDSAAFPRIFNDARNVPAIYPNGFLPLITTDIDDRIRRREQPQHVVRRGLADGFRRGRHRVRPDRVRRQHRSRLRLGTRGTREPGVRSRSPSRGIQHRGGRTHLVRPRPGGRRTRGRARFPRFPAEQRTG